MVDAKSVCGLSLAPGDSASVRGGSLGPSSDAVSHHSASRPPGYLVTVETHGHYAAQRSERGSPAPLLEEETLDEEEEPLPAQADPCNTTASEGSHPVPHTT